MTSRYQYGGDVSDFTYATQVAGSRIYVTLLANTVTTFWSAQTGGTQYTDLLDANNNPVTNISTDANGNLPIFQGPAGITAMWADAGGGRRIVHPTGSGSSLDADTANNVGNPSSLTATALAATFVSLWQASTAYTAGQLVRDPFGFTVSRIANGTSGSSYNATEAALWKDVSGFTRPQRFGAAGDGSTDDTSALQAALNAAVATGCTMQLSGRYKTTSALSLPVISTGAVSICGTVADSNPFGSTGLDKASIESTGSAVFTPASAANVILTLRDVNFRNLGASSAVLFNGLTVYQSTITGVTAAKFAWIFDSTSGVIQVSRIMGNRFENSGVCAGSVIDSFITNNYFNGDPGRNMTAFNGTIATSSISDNYIDFYKRVFDVPQGNKDVRVEGNIFDYCWNTLGTSTSQNLGSWAFVGNTWDHCTSAAALSHYTSPDSDMTGTPWSAIDSGSNALTNVTVIGSNVVGVDRFIRAVSVGVGALREAGTVYDGGYQTGLVNVQPSFYSATPADIILESINNNLVTPTFAAAQTIDWSQGAIQVVTLTANMTSLTFSNPIKNTVYRLRLIQDATGGRTWASLASNIKLGGLPQLSSPASAQDVFTFFYDGTNYYELSRTMNAGSTTYTPMGSLWQLSKSGQTDWFNAPTDSFPQVRITPVFNQGPGTYGSILFGRGNVSPDAALARGNDNQASFIANAPFLKKVVTSTLASNGTVNLNPNTGDIFVVNLQANATNFTLSTTATSTGYSQMFTVEFVQDATGSRTLASAAANIKWIGGAAPTLTTTANKKDILTFRYDGTNFWECGARVMNVG